MKKLAAITLTLLLAACGGEADESGMMEDEPDMMADSARMQDTMMEEPGMMRDTSAMGGGMGPDTGMTPDTMDAGRD